MQDEEKELNKKLFLIEDRLNIAQYFFLHDKSYLIKKTFITELNKYIALYRPIPYFPEKKEKNGINIANLKNNVSFFIDKKINK